MGLSSFQKPPLHAPLVQILQVKYAQRSTLFHLWEVVQIFQRESIFCSKTSSGGLFIKKISLRGEPILGGPFLRPWPCSPFTLKISSTMPPSPHTPSHLTALLLPPPPWRFFQCFLEDSPLPDCRLPRAELTFDLAMPCATSQRMVIGASLSEPHR